jgi:hypothetical protein
MTVTKTDLKYLIPFLLYVILGLWGSYTFEYIDNRKALNLAFRWFIVPSFVLGVVYSYYSVFKRSPSQALWRKVLGLLALTLVFTLLFLRSSQGYLILWNAHFGDQKEVVLRGIIDKLDYPKKKKPLNSYAIDIKVEDTGELINLDVPTNDYQVGETFEKKMKKGSLEIVYSH